MRLTELNQFICDSCGGLVSTIEEGWLEWLTNEQGQLHSFRIVHHATSSPARDRGGNCYYVAQKKGDMHLNHYASHNGLANLLSKFERTQHAHELVEIIRRLHIPKYEEARQFWQAATDDGFFYDLNEYAPYTQEYLTELIVRYGGEQ